jgi:hypothetical protein
MYKYQKIIDAISLAEIESAIKKMADNYDLTGLYLDKADNACDHLYGEKVFKKYFGINSDVSNLIDFFVQKDFEEEKHRLGGDDVPLEDVDFILLDSSTPEQDLKNEVKEKIYRSLLDYLVNKATQITENRENLRIPVGNIVDFNDCMISNKYLGKIEFYKDGGWGIAEEDGAVLVENHLMEQPSKAYSLHNGFSYVDSPYRIIQDIGTMQYGILSIESFCETISCIYDEIRALEFFDESGNHFFIKIKKEGKWGCYDEKCILKINCNYDIICLKNYPESVYLECVRDAGYMEYESFDANKDKNVVIGKKDLYNDKGELLLGGYDELIIGYDYLQFYFGTFYEYYTKEETDNQGYPCQLSKLRLNYENSKCLVLDKCLRTIVRDEFGYFRIPKGFVFNSFQEVERYVPSHFLFNYRVDLSNLDKGFIYLHNFYGEQYILPEYIDRGFDTPEEMKEYDDRQKPSMIDMQKRIIELQRLLEAEQDKISDNYRDIDTETIIRPNSVNYKERFVDDEIVSIVKLNKDMTIDWINNVNEVGIANYTTFYYRLKDKIGIFNEKGLHPANYDAITWDSADRITYVACYESCHQGWFLRYYKITDDGTLIQMADDLNIFNPKRHKWFPYYFNDKYYDVGFYSNDHSDNRYKYTDEDAWDAMTDGMYGDYPGPGWDPEMFGY